MGTPITSITMLANTFRASGAFDPVNDAMNGYVTLENM